MERWVVDGAMSVEDQVDNALRMVRSSPEMYQRGFDNGYNVSRRLAKRFRSLVLFGMGGSGIVGDIVRDLISTPNRKPPYVSKDYRLQTQPGPDTLSIALSYSGNTAETVTAASEAYSSGSTLVVVSSGGVLSEIAEKHRLPRVPVTSGLEPRYAVPEMVGCVLGLLHGLGMVNSLSEQFRDAAKNLHSFIEGVSADSLRDAARLMHSRVAVVIGHTHLQSSAYRLKCQLNENAKHPAYVATLPEACHNEMEGWTLPESISYIVLRSRYEPPALSAVLDQILDDLKQGGMAHTILRVDSANYVEEILRMVALGDMLSIVLASSKKADPFKLLRIPRFRRLLSMDGRLLKHAEERFKVDT